MLTLVSFKEPCPLIQLTAWTSSATNICVGCLQSKLLKNVFKENRLLIWLHSVLSQMCSILNILVFKSLFLFCFFFPLLLWFYCQLVLGFSFSFLSILHIYFLIVYYLGRVIANLWNNRKIGRENKAKENGFLRNMSLLDDYFSLFFVPGFSLFNGYIIISLLQ